MLTRGILATQPQIDLPIASSIENHSHHYAPLTRPNGHFHPRMSSLLDPSPVHFQSHPHLLQLEAAAPMSPGSGPGPPQ